MANLNLNDEDLTNVILTQNKHGITGFTNLIVESSSNALRRDVTNILENTFTHQKEVFDYMVQKGWYQVENASQQEIDNAINSVQSTINA